MDRLNHIILLAVKTKHLMPVGLLLLINALVKHDYKDPCHDDSEEYMGDNIPLDLIDRIKRA